MTGLKKSTIVRFRNAAMRMSFRYGEHVVSQRMGRVARDLWFTVPPRMAPLPVPDGGEAFEVEAQKHVVRGMVWSPPASATASRTRDGSARPPVVYLMHGWGGRGSQFGAVVQPLVAAGFRVVMLDAPAHGDSDHGPAGPRRTHGIEFARALDAAFCRFGPAQAVVAHSLGTLATYLTLRFGWLGTERLVFIAPMVSSRSLVETFQASLGFGPRTRRAFDRAVYDFVGLGVREFDARVQAWFVDPVPTLVITDRDDRQTPYAEVLDFAEKINAPLITTEGLGHRKILRDPEVISAIVDFISEESYLGATA